MTCAAAARWGPVIHALATTKADMMVSMNFKIFMAYPFGLRGGFANICWMTRPQREYPSILAGSRGA
jgi:hypothetical protein